MKEDIGVVPACEKGSGDTESRPNTLQSSVATDTMMKEGNAGARDRRTAIDLAIICEALEEARGRVRWIPHGRMPVDTLTKDDVTKGNAALHDLWILLLDERES